MCGMRGSADGSQRHKNRAIGKVVALGAGGFDCQPRFTSAARTNQRQQAAGGLIEQVGNLRQFGPSTNQRGKAGWKIEGDWRSGTMPTIVRDGLHAC